MGGLKRFSLRRKLKCGVNGSYFADFNIEKLIRVHGIVSEGRRPNDFIDIIRCAKVQNQIDKFSGSVP